MIKSLGLGLGLVLACSAARATTVSVMSPSFLKVNARDQAVSSTVQTHTVSHPSLPASPFSQLATQGRSTTSTNNGWSQTPDGLAVDVDAVLSLTSATGVPEDFAEADGFLTFSLVTAQPYSIAGFLSGDGTGVEFIAVARLIDSGTNTFVYHELATAVGNSFDFTFGMAPLTGSTAGVLPPGTYTLSYELWIQDLNGTGAAANGTGAIHFALGVPEPSLHVLLALGFSALVVRSRRTQRRI